jgi:hypothetical protein
MGEAMRSLADQLNQAIAAEREASQSCEAIGQQLWAAQQLVARLEHDQKRAYARYQEWLTERKKLEAEMARERMYTDRRLR